MEAGFLHLCHIRWDIRLPPSQTCMHPTTTIVPPREIENGIEEKDYKWAFMPLSEDLVNTVKGDRNPERALSICTPRQKDLLPLCLQNSKKLLRSTLINVNKKGIKRDGKDWTRFEKKKGPIYNTSVTVSILYFLIFSTSENIDGTHIVRPDAPTTLSFNVRSLLGDPAVVTTPNIYIKS